MTRDRSIRPDAGFTLVEILVSALLAAVLLAGVMSMTTFQVSATRDQSAQIELQQAVRNVAELFVREVRRSGSNPTCSANVRALEYASAWMVYLNSDLDGDGAISFTNESIIYQYDPSTRRLRRIANGQTETLVTDVVWDTSRIHYFDANGIELETGMSSLSLADRNRVRRIRFTIEVERRTQSGEILRAQASSDVNLRNRFFIRPAVC